VAGGATAVNPKRWNRPVASVQISGEISGEADISLGLDRHTASEDRHMFKDFKSFALRGNVIDLAVGVIIGASFTGIVNSLVSDILMPPLGMLLGGIDFSDFFIVLKGPHTCWSVGSTDCSPRPNPHPPHRPKAKCCWRKSAIC
jgi:hypothetical protein